MTDNKGEWKGAFSDKSSIWEKLLVHSGVSLPRTNANDGTFWIGYDDFLMGFSNVDVVLAFRGNHAKSFVTNFATKKSNHRCVRAFEVSLIDPQPGIETKDRVEVYVMGIQKNRRGARQGRADRKKSYKISDMGMLVGEYASRASSDDEDDHESADSLQFASVHGQMFGFQRNGHYRLVLDRNCCKRMVVMPISFGHPAATDTSLSFVVRFNADSPLMIRELQDVPRIDRVFCDFLFQPKPPGHFETTRQGQQKILLETKSHRIVQIDCLGNSGGAFFVYLCCAPLSGVVTPISFRVVSRCRGMSCRTVDGLLEHETIAKGKKFEASWRQYQVNFENESKSRLLMVLYQSGQDTEMGSVTCSQDVTVRHGTEKTVPKDQAKYAKGTTLDDYWKTARNSDKTVTTSCNPSHEDLAFSVEGIFHPVSMDNATYSRCGRNQHLSVLPNDSLRKYQQHFILPVDTDLLKAIELSRMETNGAVEFEPAMIGAYVEECSRREGIAFGEGSTYAIRDEVENAQHEFVYSDEEVDLKRAIELSMMDKRVRTTTCDTVSDMLRKGKPLVDSDVLDCTDTGKYGNAIDAVVPTGPTNDGNDPVVLDLTNPDGNRLFSEKPASKRRKVHSDVEISKAESPIGPQSEETSESKLETDRNFKRSLAADAALRRMERR